MNKTSTDKIKLAAPFLIWFRRCLPQSLQIKVRPYLDSPYQLALNVLDCCDSTRPLTVREIAQVAGVAQETTRQVLQALKDGGLPFAVSPGRGWQAIREKDAKAGCLTLLTPGISSQESAAEFVTTKQ